MGLFKTRVDENWKINYIKEFNEMRSEYEKKILSKQNEIDDLKKQLEELKCFRSNLRPKEKQIKDTDIQTSRYCGIYCIYTKTRCKGFTFHHIQLSNNVETDTTPDETPDHPGTDIPDNPNTPELPKDVRGMLLFNEIMYNNATDGAEYIEI